MMLIHWRRIYIIFIKRLINLWHENRDVTGFGIAMPYREYSEELEKQVNDAFNYTVNEAFSDSQIIEEDESASMGKDDDKIMKRLVSPVDVIAISFAIYEDFFDTIPGY